MTRHSHISGVTPSESVPSTATSPRLSSRRTRTASGTFSHAASPRGVTPRAGALSAYRLAFSLVRSARRTSRRLWSRNDASDTSTSSQLLRHARQQRDNAIEGPRKKISGREEGDAPVARDRACDGGVAGGGVDGVHVRAAREGGAYVGGACVCGCLEESRVLRGALVASS